MTQFLTSTSITRSSIFIESPGKSFRPGKRGGPSGLRLTPSSFFLRSWNILSRGLAGELALEALSVDEVEVVKAVEVGVSGSCCASERCLTLPRAVPARFLGFLDDGEPLLLLP